MSLRTNRQDDSNSFGSGGYSGDSPNSGQSSRRWSEVNRRHCCQRTLKLAIDAIDADNRMTGQITADQDEFICTLVAKPKEVREHLLRIGPSPGKRPVGYLIAASNKRLTEWKQANPSNSRWMCWHCGVKPFDTWDACYKCGSLSGY